MHLQKIIGTVCLLLSLSAAGCGWHNPGPHCEGPHPHGGMAQGPGMTGPNGSGGLAGTSTSEYGARPHEKRRC
ncbi:hypothetical protein [Acetobacter sp.]|uniref:hypothetical protein n=1 Tax=Acetobacter sp. TaxID=440 RepID=UPI003F8FBF08